jgi:hypothetical protein
MLAICCWGWDRPLQTRLATANHAAPPKQPREMREAPPGPQILSLVNVD